MKNILLILTFMLCFTIASANKEEKKDTPATETKESDKPSSVNEKSRPELRHYSEESIKKIISELTAFLKNLVKDPNKNSYMIIDGYAFQLSIIMKSSDLELDTCLYLWWYKKLHKNLLAMSAPKKAMEYAKLNHDEKKYEEQKTLFMEQISLYRKIISVDKKKAQIPDDKLKELQKKKEKAEEEAAKKKRRR